MDDEIEVKVYRSATDMKSTIAATIQDTLSHATCHEIVQLVAEKIADRYVEEHYAEIVAKFDQQAIANLAVADSGKKIAEEIRTRPVVLHDKETRREVYQRGIFGGLRRVL